MDATGVKLLNLMFRPGETICLSHNKYAYHSIPLEQIYKDKVTLVPADEARSFEYVDSGLLTLAALNPIKGIRQDTNCTAFRNFLVEMDYGPLPQQLLYAQQLKLPYSAVVFSGSKSLHFLISLDQDLPNEEVWRTFAEWILNIMTMADQATKNPSRGIRIPGALREPGKKQLMVEYKGATKVEDLYAWLNSHPDAKPKKPEKREISATFDPGYLKEWVSKSLRNGLDPNKGRNKQWFAIACEFALAGYSEDDTFDILAQFFTPDRDFKEREWKTSIRSGFKYIYERK